MIDTQFQSAQTMNCDSYTSATQGRKLLPDERKRKKTKASCLLDSIQTKYCPFLLFMAVTTLEWSDEMLSKAELFAKDDGNGTSKKNETQEEKRMG